MPYEADDYLSRHVQTSEVDLTRKVDELVALANSVAGASLRRRPFPP